MKHLKTSSIALAALLIAACSSSKKATTSTVSTTSATTTVTTTTTAGTTTAATAGPALSPAAIAKSKGIFDPGNEELTAIQATYKDASMETLHTGYTIYTGECTNCHGAKSIYKRTVEEWPGIIDDMAQKSNLTAIQKDAVYKFVLAIKATQPKAAK
jgi:cytochrome c1